MTAHNQTFVDRRDQTMMTPEYEDSGLFKSDVLRLDVQLTPVMYRNSRQDLVVQAYSTAQTPFEVVFAGRRLQMAAAIVRNLDVLKASATCDTSARQAPDLDRLRLPIKVEGAWRRRFWTDQSGWQTRVYQLVAARWALQDKSRKRQSFGEAPAVGQGPAVH